MLRSVQQCVLYSVPLSLRWAALTRIQIPNGISIGSADFFAQLTTEHPFLMGHPSVSKLFLLMGIWTPSNT